MRNTLTSKLFLSGILLAVSPLYSVADTGNNKEQVIGNNNTVEACLQPLDIRTYTLSDFLPSGDYEIRLNKTNIQCNCRRNSREQLEYCLEFQDLNNPNHRFMLPLNDFDNNRAYGLSLENKDCCTVPERFSLKEILPKQGKYLQRISKEDIKLILVAKRYFIAPKQKEKDRSGMDIQLKTGPRIILDRPGMIIE